MTKVWIVGKERRENEIIVQLCEKHKWHMLTVEKEEYFWDLAESMQPNLLFIDSSHTKEMLKQFVRKIREAGHRYSVILIYDRDWVDLAMQGFKEGADDAIQLPISETELETRANRTLEHEGKERCMNTCQAITLNGIVRYESSGNALVKGKRKVILTKDQGKLFEALYQAKGWPITKVELGKIMGCGPDPTVSKSIEVQVSKLRKKLSALSSGVEIAHMKGRGYSIQGIRGHR